MSAGCKLSFESKSNMCQSHNDVFLLRHGHRHVIYERDDNGLSERGNQQVSELSQYLLPLCEHNSPLLVCSPKLRCLETVAPLAQLLNVEVRVSQFIDEQNGNESQFDFESRVKNYVSDICHALPDTLIICSHGDVLPLILHNLTRQTMLFRPAGLVRLAQSGSRFLIKETKDFSD